MKAVKTLEYPNGDFDGIKAEQAQDGYLKRELANLVAFANGAESVEESDRRNVLKLLHFYFSTDSVIAKEIAENLPTVADLTSNNPEIALAANTQLKAMIDKLIALFERETQPDRKIQYKGLMLLRNQIAANKQQTGISSKPSAISIVNKAKELAGRRQVTSQYQVEAAKQLAGDKPEKHQNLRAISENLLGGIKRLLNFHGAACEEIIKVNKTIKVNKQILNKKHNLDVIIQIFQQKLVMLEEKDDTFINKHIHHTRHEHKKIFYKAMIKALTEEEKKLTPESDINTVLRGAFAAVKCSGAYRISMDKVTAGGGFLGTSHTTALLSALNFNEQDGVKRHFSFMGHRFEKFGLKPFKSLMPGVGRTSLLDDISQGVNIDAKAETLLPGRRKAQR